MKRAKKVVPRAEGRIARGQPRFSPNLLETSESSEDSCDSTISSPESAIVLKAISKLSMWFDKMHRRLV